MTLSVACVLEQVEQREEQNKLIQSALDEKRAELLKTETSLREMEEKYYSSSAAVHEKIVPDLRVTSQIFSSIHSAQESHP